MSNNSKRNLIGKHIDIDGCRLKEEEANQLIKLIEDISSLVGKSRTHRRQFTDCSSDGKYTRTIETTYTVCNDHDRIYINENEEYWDDDGGSGHRSVKHTAAREILKLLYRVL